ncbi:hypothetical protein [Rhodopirellula sp. MGV]|uniref:hypothetical protein n=1 Tax=Rhodopirellula sp. MGV TaxID=2023130 RepID=UPI000B95FD29|nr:hypothetical protein [Rhodopirellula sp. MGV]OYP34533.1 hypothetical protein CGZ80_14140 [Rhodopirellula sp. MGV]PNY36751.1 hypothetical protein C2E31_11610 [Rhodopirellula baltica]
MDVSQYNAHIQSHPSGLSGAVTIVLPQSPRLDIPPIRSSTRPGASSIGPATPMEFADPAGTSARNDSGRIWANQFCVVRSVS